MPAAAIDPRNITNYDLDQHGLQKHLLFWVLVAGKTAKVIAVRLESVLEEGYKRLPSRERGKAAPFEAMRALGSDLSEVLKRNGIGCYKIKARGIQQLLEKDFDLRTCSLEDLESICGIGQKTSRCFLLHTRRNVRVAGLDTHVLKFLRDKGYDVPVSTPSGKRYREIEQIWLSLADKSGKSLADYDLEIWKKYSKR